MIFSTPESVSVLFDVIVHDNFWSQQMYLCVCMCVCFGYKSVFCVFVCVCVCVLVTRVYSACLCVCQSVRVHLCLDTFGVFDFPGVRKAFQKVQRK